MDEVIHKNFKNESKIKKNNNIQNSLTQNIRRSSKSNKKSKTKTKKKQKGNPLPKKINDKTNSKPKNILFNKRNSNNIGLINIPLNIENKNKKFIIKESPQMKPDTDYEFNWLLYQDVLRYDKRSNCDYYGSLIRSKQLFIFTFCSFNDYNSGVIKKFMFFLSFAYIIL